MASEQPERGRVNVALQQQIESSKAPRTPVIGDAVAYLTDIKFFIEDQGHAMTETSAVQLSPLPHVTPQQQEQAQAAPHSKLRLQLANHKIKELEKQVLALKAERGTDKGE